MENTTRKNIWANANAYESYVGRWSRLIAQEFVGWLAVPQQHDWLDVGCGTGALSQTILQLANPKRIKGLDRSEAFVALAKENVPGLRVAFDVADAQELPEESASYDVVVSALMLNFIPVPEKAVAEMARVVRPGGQVALYVWDYSGLMQFMRHFWNAAAALDPKALELDEGRRCLICNPSALQNLFAGAGLHSIETRPIDINTDFKDFDDFWAPFLEGQGPAPAYAMSLSEERRAALRERLRASLPFAADGSIPLVARAWAVRGLK